MADFAYDVFLSYSSKDKTVVRALAERLREDGLLVWLDQWVLRPGANIPYEIERGLESSRLLLLCLSANALASDWARLESQTFRFRDPVNKDLRFVPLRLDDSEPRGSLGQFLYIDWRPKRRKHEYVKLLEACQRGQSVETLPPSTPERNQQLVHLQGGGLLTTYAFGSDRQRILAGCGDGSLELWDSSGRHLRRFLGHSSNVNAVAWSADQRHALSASSDATIRLWDVETAHCLRVLQGHKTKVSSVAWAPDQRYAASSSYDDTIIIWNVENGESVKIIGPQAGYATLAWSANGHHILTGSDEVVRLWDSDTGKCVHELTGHTGVVYSVALNADASRAISGAWDKTVRYWDLDRGQCLMVLEGHTANVFSVALSGDGRHALSSGADSTVRLWDLQSGRCLAVLKGHKAKVFSVAWSSDQRYAFSGDYAANVTFWDLSEFFQGSPGNALYAPAQILYTNAKVLLVGDSSAGKTGLSMRLGKDDWQPSDSTVGVWATQWKLPVASKDGVEREVWLWDFGGQADQRLIHQLYMDEAAMAVLVFDGQRDDVMETLGQWDRDLSRGSGQNLSKLLVAARIDAGGLRIGRDTFEAFCRERGYLHFLETSAKQDIGCRELKNAVVSGIDWDHLPWRSSPSLFKRLKEEIVRLKDAGRVLIRFNELRETLTLRLAGDGVRFTDDALKAVIGLLAGPGVVWELKFGSWVLLQPEQVNAYAQAVIQMMRTDPYERGCVAEESVLQGDLVYLSSMARLRDDEERFVLLAMHQTLVERGLCIRQQTDKGVLLIFPSYYRRERKELVNAPNVLVSYRFTGFLDDIYATLVVRLHHTNAFERDALWRYAADFKTLGGQQLGIRLNRRAEGVAELEVYFDREVESGEKIIFSKYIHEHLLQNARDVVRLRHYACPHCGTPVGNREVAIRRLKEGKKDVICVDCEQRIPLWDKLEELFASPDVKERVRVLEERSKIVLDNESKERALVGEVISTVALAGEISREFNVSDQGIDMEIEFRSDDGKATGQKLYLQLKSGDSYLRRRKKDGAEIFAIRNQRHALYWSAQAFPVLLVIRNADGQIRWMDVREYLRRHRKHVRQVEFAGERFDVMSVRRWRDRILAD